MILEALRKKVFEKNETFAGKWIIKKIPFSRALELFITNQHAYSA
jgi:hypothetical protein